MSGQGSRILDFLFPFIHTLLGVEGFEIMLGYLLSLKLVRGDIILCSFRVGISSFLKVDLAFFLKFATPYKTST